MKNQREKNIEDLIAKCRPVMALQDKAFSTEKQYLFYLRDYLRFTYSQPRVLASERKFEIWLSKMVLEKDCSVSAQSVAFNAVCWFYKDVLRRPLKDVDGLRATKPVQVRTALPQNEVMALLADVRDVSGYPTHFIVRMIYSCGMRLGDSVNLRVKDLVFERREIIIRGGKGKKDRVLGMPEDLVVALQRQLVVAHAKWEQDVRNKIPVQLDGLLGKKYPEYKFSWHWAFIFPQHWPCKHPRTGQIVRYRMPHGKVQQAVRESRRRLGLNPQLTPHVLRHSFATHLLDRGVKVTALQKQMGHSDVRTTFGYDHSEAKSVPDPVALARFDYPVALVYSAPVQAKRIGFKNA
jgi:integrase